MKVKKPVRGYKIIDLGPLDSYRRVGACSERIAAMKSFVCEACRKPIEQNPWILGFKKHDIKGIPWGLRLHEECWDGTGKDVGVKNAKTNP